MDVNFENYYGVSNSILVFNGLLFRSVWAKVVLISDNQSPGTRQSDALPVVRGVPRVGNRLFN